MQSATSDVPVDFAAGDSLTQNGGEESRPPTNPQTRGESGSPTPSGTSNTGASGAGSLKEEPVREGSVGGPPSPSISEEQKGVVRECLRTIEAGLSYAGVHLNPDKILPYVEAITRRDDSVVAGEALLKSNGIYIVQHGVLDMCAADGETVTQRLEAGEFFGELSVLFRVPSNRGVNVVSREVTLLHLPVEVVRKCASVDAGAEGFSKNAMLRWCVKRSYLETGDTFGPKVLARKVVLSCLEASVLSDLSQGAREFVAELASPMLFDPGDVIYRAGDEANYIYLLLKGKVDIKKDGDTIETKETRCSDQGCCLGYLEFFGGVKFTYSAVAVGPVIVALVSKETLLEMLNEHTEDLAALQALLSKYKIHKQR